MRESRGTDELRTGEERRVRAIRPIDPAESPTEAVVYALEELERTTDTATIRPLYEYVDPDALDSLFATRPDGSERPDGEVRFDVDDVIVVIRPDVVQIVESTECG